MNWKDHFRNNIIIILGKLLKIPYRLLLRIAIGPFSILRQALWVAGLRRDAGPGSHISRYVIMHSPTEIVIGNKVSINEFVHIWGSGGVHIGDNSLIGSHTVITTLTHDKMASLYRETIINKPINIGDNVWIGTGAIILPGISIGDGAIIGSGAVVTKDVAANDIVVGIPARSSIHHTKKVLDDIK